MNRELGGCLPTCAIEPEEAVVHWPKREEPRVNGRYTLGPGINTGLFEILQRGYGTLPPYL